MVLPQYRMSRWRHRRQQCCLLWPPSWISCFFHQAKIERWELQSLSSKPWLVFIPNALDLPSNSRVKAHANACILVRVSPPNTVMLCWAQLLFSILNLNHSKNFFATLWLSCCLRTSKDWSSRQFPPCMHMGYGCPRFVVAERRASVAAEAGCLGLLDANGSLSEGPVWSSPRALRG